MTTITTGTRAIDTRDGRTVTIGEKNSKCKTVIVFYDEPTEKEANGKSMSFSTVKKHFDLQVWESDAETEKKETYDVVREHDMLTDEVEEIAAPEAEKTEKKARKPRTKKENPARAEFTAKAVAALTAAGYEVKVWEKIPNLFAIKSGKKTLAEVRTGLKGWTLNTKKEIADALAEDYPEQKYFLPATLRYGYEEFKISEFIAALA